MVRNAVFTEPADQSAWIYQEFLLGEDINNVELLEAHLFVHDGKLGELLLIFNQNVKCISPHLLSISGCSNSLNLETLTPNSNIQRLEFQIDLDFSSPQFVFKATESAFQGSKVNFLSTEITVACDAMPSVELNYSKELNNVQSKNRTYATRQPKSVWLEELKHLEDLYELEPESKCFIF